MRSVGDARRAMNVTLAVAIVNIILDPIFIFGLGLGINGAALASTIARSVSMCVGLYGVIRATWPDGTAAHGGHSLLMPGRWARSLCPPS